MGSKGFFRIPGHYRGDKMHSNSNVFFLTTMFYIKYGGRFKKFKIHAIYLAKACLHTCPHPHTPSSIFLTCRHTCTHHTESHLYHIRMRCFSYLFVFSNCRLLIYCSNYEYIYINILSWTQIAQKGKKKTAYVIAEPCCYLTPVDYFVIDYKSRWWSMALYSMKFHFLHIPRLYSR